MSNSASSIIRKNWEIKLTQWRTRGLSGTAWSREMGIPYHRFLYWKKRISLLTSDSEQCLSALSAFVGVNKPSKLISGVTIELNGAKIILTKDFDIETLELCLHVLRRF